MEWKQIMVDEQQCDRIRYYIQKFRNGCMECLFNSCKGILVIKGFVFSFNFLKRTEN